MERHSSIVFLMREGTSLLQSSNPFALRILNEFDLLTLLDVVIGGDDVRRQKPDPEPIFKALNLLGVKPENACFVGDTVHDIKAAKLAGCIPIGFRLKAEISIEELEELIQILKEKS